MLAAGPPPLEVCGGLLALTQDHKPIKLIAPFTAAVLRLKPTDAAKGAIEGETEGAVEGAVEGAEPCSPEERIDAWRLPLGWLICRCDDLEAAQLELLSALEPLGGADDTGPLPLKQAAPTLKALWECQASLTLPFPPTCHTPFSLYITDICFLAAPRGQAVAPVEGGRGSNCWRPPAAEVCPALFGVAREYTHLRGNCLRD